MNSRAEGFDRRLAVYAALATRNRIIAVLRIGLPLLGALVLGIFILQILLASLGNNFGIGKVSFNGDAVTVDTPSYSGVMADGDIYKVSAQLAQTAVTSLNVIQLTDAGLTLTKPDGTTMTAHATTGSFETLGQIVTVPGTAEVSDSKGNAGTLQKVEVDLPRQILKATGPVKLSFADGATVESSGLTYDAKADRWDFGRATLTVPASTDDGVEQSP